MTMRAGLLLAFSLALTGCGSDSSDSGTGGSGTGGSGTGGASGSGGTSGSGGSTGGAFGCLGKVVLPTTTETQGQLTALVADGLTQQPVAGVTTKLCKLDDLTCATPVGTTTTDAKGLFTVDLPLTSKGFDGYGELSLSGYLTTLLYASAPVIPDPGNQSTYLVVTEAAFGIAAQASGVQIDPSKGTILAWMYDCDRKSASGLSLEVAGGAGGTIAYLQGGGTISTTATETDAGGIAYLLNAPPGKLTLTSKRASTGEQAGTATINVRAGSMTELFFWPTP
jgi:5-hydroxyisourate hydrolase-like protein (transthyretin family)